MKLRTKVAMAAWAVVAGLLSLALEAVLPSELAADTCELRS